MTLETKLEFIADFEVGKWVVIVGHELGIPFKIVRKIVMINVVNFSKRQMIH
jgi:hypothetical protein